MPEKPTSFIPDPEPSSFVPDEPPVMFLPELPKPKVPGLTAPRPGVSTAIQGMGARPGGPVDALAKVADWGIEGMEEGLPRAYTGYQTALGWGTPTADERAQGVADVIGGGMEASRPAMLGLGARLPGAIASQGWKPFAKSLAVGALAPPAVRTVAPTLGVPKGTTEMLAEASGVLPIAEAGSAIVKAKPFTWNASPKLSKLDETLEKLASPMHKRYTDFFNEQHPFWELEKIADIPLEQSAARQMESYGGTTGKIHDVLLEYRDKMMPFKKDGTWEKAKPYGINERHIERGMDDPDYAMPGGKTMFEVGEEMNALEQSLTPAEMGKVHMALKTYRDMHRKLLNELADEGLISTEFRDSANKHNQSFMPFQRVEYLQKELMENRLPAGRAKSVPGTDFTKQMVGSEKEIVDPDYGFVRNAYRVKHIIERNRIAKSVARYADAPETRDLVFRINPHTQNPVDFDGNPINVPMDYKTISYMEGGNVRKVAVPEFLHKTLVNMDSNSLNIMTKTMQNAGKILQTGVVLSPRFWLNNMGRDYLTAATTVGIDPITWGIGFMSSLTRGIPSSKVPSYLKKLGIGDEVYRSFLRSGGAHGGPFEYSSPISITEGLLDTLPEKLVKKAKTPLKSVAEGALNTLSEMGTTAELVPRLGIFQKSRTPSYRQTTPTLTGAAGTVEKVSPGKPDWEAGWIARNATVNFQVEGAALKQYNKVTPFLRARMGATRTVLGSLQENPKAVSMRLAGTLGIPTAFLYYNNVLRFPDVWDSIDSDVKRTKMVLIQGREQDERGRYTNVKTFPMDGIPAAFVGAINASMDAWRGKDAKEWAKSGVQFLSDFSPVGFLRKGEFSPNEIISSLANPLITGPIEATTGVAAYTGRDLQRRKGVRMDASPEERYNNEAKLPYVALSHSLAKAGVKFSPHVLEHVLGSTFGGHLGRDLSESMPTVGGRGWSNQVRVNPFIGPVASKPEEGLGMNDMETERGNRLQNFRRAGDKILALEGLTPEKMQAGAISALSELKAKYPDEDPGKMQAEFGEMLKGLAVAKSRGYNRLETDLLLTPSEIRAKAMLRALDRAPSQSMRDNYIKRWSEIRLLTPKVQAEMKLEREKQLRLQSAPQVR